MTLFPGQEYPKYMYHASKPQVMVYSKREQTELGPEWSETYIYQAYPKCKYTWNEKTVIVKDAEGEATLGAGWTDNPAAFRPYLGPRPPKAQEQDATKWVDEWSIPGVSSEDRRKIKAQLLRADSAFWRSPDAASADLEAMRQAFTGVAKVLSEAGILTEELLRNEIPILVWDSAIVGGWYRFASESPQDIFPEQLGHYWVWRDEGTDWKNLFYSETGVWLAWLLENPKVEVDRADTRQTRTRPMKTALPSKERRTEDQVEHSRSEGRSASDGRAANSQTRARKGDLTLLQDPDGTLKESVSFEHARSYLGVSGRQVERLVYEKKSLAIIGGGHNKRITVVSLLAYLPGEKATQSE